jgi:septal ring factor EnvC (AmiA/AmiB activator)
VLSSARTAPQLCIGPNLPPFNHINTNTTTNTGTMAQPPTGAAAQNRTIAQVRDGKDRLDSLVQQCRHQMAQSNAKGYTAEEMEELDEVVAELKTLDASLLQKESALEQQKRVMEAATAGRFGVPREAVPDISQPTKRAWMKLLERSVHKGPDFLRRLVDAIESEDPGLLGSHAVALVPQAPADEQDDKSSSVGPVEYEYQVAIDGLNEQVQSLRKQLEEATISLKNHTSIYKEAKSSKDKQILGLKEEVKKLGDRVDDLKAKVESRDESIGALNTTVAEMCEVNKQATNEVSEANEQLAEARAATEAADNDRQKLERQVAEQQRQLEASTQAATTLRHNADTATALKHNAEAIVAGLLQSMSLGPTDPGTVASRLLDGNANSVILPPVGGSWPIYYDPEGAPGVHLTFQSLAIELLSSSDSLGSESIFGLLSMMRDGLMRYQSTVLDSVLQLFSSAMLELAEAFQQDNIHYPGWLMLSQISGLLGLARPGDHTAAALDAGMEELDPLVASLAKAVRNPGRLDSLPEPWESGYFPEHDITLIGCREEMPGMLVMEEALQRMIWVPRDNVMERRGYIHPVVIKRRGGEPWTLNLEHGGLVFAMYNIPPSI